MKLSEKKSNEMRNKRVLWIIVIKFIIAFLYSELTRKQTDYIDYNVLLASKILIFCQKLFICF